MQSCKTLLLTLGTFACAGPAGGKGRSRPSRWIGHRRAHTSPCHLPHHACISWHLLPQRKCMPRACVSSQEWRCREYLFTVTPSGGCLADLKTALTLVFAMLQQHRAGRGGARRPACTSCGITLDDWEAQNMASLRGRCENCEQLHKEGNYCPVCDKVPPALMSSPMPLID